MGEGITAALKVLEMPSKDAMIEAYKDAKNDIKRIDVNSINVRFYEKNSPFFYPTRGVLYHVGIASLVTIQVPHKLGWILMDDSIEIDKITKETWISCRQDYPLTLSANRQVANAVIEAMALHPDIQEWFIPTSLGRMPVKQIIIKRNKRSDASVKDAVSTLPGGARNLIEMIDAMPSDINVTTQLLYDIPDMKLAEGLNDTKPKGQFMTFIFGGVFFSFFALLMFLYLKI